MVSTKQYVPKRSDIVSVAGMELSTFRVIEIESSGRTVNLTNLDTGHYMVEIPWIAVTLVRRKTREDVNQAAFRTLREAPERD